MDTFYNCWEVAPVCRWHWPIPNAPHRDLRKTCPMNFVKLPVSHRATQVPITAKDDEHHRMFWSEFLRRNYSDGSRESAYLVYQGAML